MAGSKPWPATDPASQSWPSTRNSVTLAVQQGLMKAPAGAGGVSKRGTLCPVHICSPDVEAASPSLWGGRRRKGGVVGRSGRRRPCDPRHVPHPKAASSSAADLRLVLLLVGTGAS